MGAVVEETESAAARGGVVDNLGHHRLIVAEVKLVADSDFTGGLHKHIPELVFGIELAKQKHFNARPGLFLVAEQPGRENLGIVEHKNVAVVEIVDDILEYPVLDFTARTVDHHQA